LWRFQLWGPKDLVESLLYSQPSCGIIRTTADYFLLPYILPVTPLVCKYGKYSVITQLSKWPEDIHFMGNGIMDKSLMGRCPSGKMYFWANLWAEEMSQGKRLQGKCRLTLIHLLYILKCCVVAETSFSANTCLAGNVLNYCIWAFGKPAIWHNKTGFFKTIPRLYLSGKFSFVVTITAYTSIDMLLIAR
jgi:hypothetical protein